MGGSFRGVGRRGNGKKAVVPGEKYRGGKQEGGEEDLWLGRREVDEPSVHTFFAHDKRVTLLFTRFISTLDLV